MHLDVKAAEIVLRSLREAIPTRWPAKVDELRSLRLRARNDLSLGEFLDESGLDLDDVYDGGKSWSDLRQARRLPRIHPSGPHEAVLRRAVGRVLPRGRRRTDHHLPPTPRRADATCRRGPAERERRLLHMLVASVTDRVITPRDPASRRRSTCCGRTRRCAASCSSCSGCSTVGSTTCTRHSCAHPTAPLQMHARYTRIEILAAFGLGRRRQDRGLAERRLRGEGRQRRAVRLHARQEQRRILTDHPIPRLRDQPHPDPLGEPVGDPRRQPDRTSLPQPRHATAGSILLFARLRADDRAFWFLGPATYRGHVGETSDGHHLGAPPALSGDLYQSFAAASRVSGNDCNSTDRR